MTELTPEEEIVRKKNIRLGLIFGGFAALTVLVAMYNFFYSGLPQDPNRMRERFKKRTAAEAQNLSEALQNAEAIQDSTKSEEVE